MWNIVHGWWVESDQRMGTYDLCAECRAAELREMEDKFAFEASITRWNLDKGDYAKMRLATYRPLHPTQQLALAAARRFLESTERGECRGMWLWSHGYGVGKTHLLVSVLWETARAGQSIAMYDEPGLLSAIRDTYNGNDKSDHDIIRQAKDARVFGLDDLGRGHVKPVSMSWYQDIMYQILNERYNVGRPTIVTSNMEPNQLGERLGGPAYSRLQGLCPKAIQVMGEDYRIRSERR